MIDRPRSMFLPTRKLRIGAVSYLNSKPLIEGLGQFAPEAELILDVPSRLADDLGRGRLDVALIPSVEAFGDPDYEVVSDACVATHGPVMSVKLYSRVHPGEIQTLALDAGSRTSAALVQVMLAERYGVYPRTEPFGLDRQIQDSSADAILMIGDRAMHTPVEQFHTVWDLGAEWLSWTGLPFVFAMWVTRRETDLGEVEQALSLARDLGLARLPQIASREALKLGLSADQGLTYLREHLHFVIGSPERNGLRVFHQLASENGFAPPGELSFRKLRCTPRELATSHCE